MRYMRQRGATLLIVAVSLVCLLLIGITVYHILGTNTKALTESGPVPAPHANGTSSGLAVGVPPGDGRSASTSASNTVPSPSTTTKAPPVVTTTTPKKLKPTTSPVPIPPLPLPLDLAPAPIVAPTSVPISVQLVAPPMPAVIAIDPQALVGVLCYFHATYTNQATGKSVVADQLVEDRGSGVIIASHGYILTNRHVVQPARESSTIPDASGNDVSITIDYSLDRCEVGQLPKGAHLPTVDEIRSLNPFVQIPVLGYTAAPVFVSPTNGRSAIEVDAADFAILKINGVSASGPTFGITSVPTSFPYATMLPVSDYDPLKEQVVTYGFPGDVTAGQGNAFETLTMTGSVGTITQIEGGDVFYKDMPLIITASMDVTHGRSGSPLFWRGYVIGIVTYYSGDNRTDSGSVASDAILKSLQGTGYYGG